MFYFTHLDAYSKPGASIQFCGAKLLICCDPCQELFFYSINSPVNHG